MLGSSNIRNECKKQIEGVQNPKFKKFLDYGDAEAFVSFWNEKRQSPKNHMGSSVKSEFCSRTSMDQSKGDQRFYRNSFFHKKRQHKLKHSNSIISKRKRNHNLRRHATQKVFSRQDNSYMGLLPGTNFNSTSMGVPQRYFHMVFPEDSVDVQNVHDIDSVFDCHKDTKVVREMKSNEIVTVGSESDHEAKSENECAKEGAGILIESFHNEHTDVQLYCETRNDVQCNGDSPSSKVRGEDERTLDFYNNIKHNCESDEKLSEICRRTLKEQLESLDISGLSKKIYLKSITSSLEKIVNVVTNNLNEISSRIVSYINNDMESDTFEESAVKVPQECTMSNTFSGGMGQLNESPNVNLTLLKEKLDTCERKIDMCFGQISSVVAGLTQAKDEIRDLRNIFLGNSNAMKEIVHTANALSPTNSRCFTTSAIIENSSLIDGNSFLHGINEQDFQDDDLDDCETPKKRKRTSEEPSDNTSNELECSINIKQEKQDYIGFTIDKDDYVLVYTDGACISNGTENAKAGIGIWFGDGHPMNVGKPLNGGPPTNNNAEIQAARIAIELALSAGIKKLKILTDSEFLINCATKWMRRWKQKDWMTGSNQPVKNRTELEKLDEVMCKLSLRWEKVVAHCGIRGNEFADQLANQGAALYVKP